jgi:hypothetical protein
MRPDSSSQTRTGWLGATEKHSRRPSAYEPRGEPKAYAGGRVYHVYHPDYKGPKTQPPFDAVMCAYNYYCGGGDTVTAGRPRVKPGDTILVHAGVYKYHPEYYGSVMNFPAVLNDHSVNATTPFEGKDDVRCKPKSRREGR